MGLNYLHKEVGCIHTDIKPENILVSPRPKQLMEMYESVPKQFVGHNKSVDVSMFYTKEQNQERKKQKKKLKKKKIHDVKELEEETVPGN